jgi:hypothetical protein
MTQLKNKIKAAQLGNTGSRPKVHVAADVQALVILGRNLRYHVAQAAADRAWMDKQVGTKGTRPSNLL